MPRGGPVKCTLSRSAAFSAARTAAHSPSGGSVSPSRMALSRCSRYRPVSLSPDQSGSSGSNSESRSRGWMDRTMSSTLCASIPPGVSFEWSRCATWSCGAGVPGEEGEIGRVLGVRNGGDEASARRIGVMFGVTGKSRRPDLCDGDTVRADSASAPTVSGSWTPLWSTCTTSPVPSSTRQSEFR